MAIEAIDAFPWSLQEAWRDGVGVGVWSMADGASLWMERSDAGYEALASRNGELRLGARWAWSGAPGHSSCEAVEVWGPGADLLAKSGLGGEEKSQRILTVMGAMAMGQGKSAAIGWEDWQALKAHSGALSMEAGFDPWEALLSAKALIAPKSRGLGGGRHG